MLQSENRIVDYVLNHRGFFPNILKCSILDVVTMSMILEQEGYQKEKDLHRILLKINQGLAE